jgi:hypothetical protein
MRLKFGKVNKPDRLISLSFVRRKPAENQLFSKIINQGRLVCLLI